MANRDRREELRGAEEETCDLPAEVLTSQQWAELLKAPLAHAARQGNRGLAQKLVGAGADFGGALHHAVCGGHGDVVNDLLENGASVDAKDAHDMTPLHVAAEEGKSDMVQLLLLKGADKDALDIDAWTPLYLAVGRGYVAAALALLAAGADVSLRYDHWKKSIVHLAARGGHVAVLRAAIERGAEVEAVDTNQNTALHIAALFTKGKTIDVLVEAGANIKAGDIDGCTPLHGAAFQVSLEALLALLKHGAHVNAQNNYQEMPLHYAAAKAGTKGTAEVVDSLLRSGADETILDDEGKAAAAVVARDVEEEDQLTEDVDRVRELLANAPADRAWRRRGYLVLCRAHPDRVQQIQDISSACTGVARSTGSNAELARTKTGSCTRASGGSTVDGRASDDLVRLVARVLDLQEDRIFRSVVGYV